MSAAEFRCKAFAAVAAGATVVAVVSAAAGSAVAAVTAGAAIAAVAIAPWAAGKSVPLKTRPLCFEDWVPRP